jgi:hypothetical protein
LFLCNGNWTEHAQRLLNLTTLFSSPVPTVSLMETMQKMQSQEQSSLATFQWRTLPMNASDSQRELARQMALLGMDPRNYLTCSKEKEMRYTDEGQARLGDPVPTSRDPEGLFKKLDYLFGRLNELGDAVYHMHDRFVGAGPETQNGLAKEPPYNGAISRYEDGVENALRQLSLIEERLGQINRRF